MTCRHTLVMPSFGLRGDDRVHSGRARNARAETQCTSRVSFPTSMIFGEVTGTRPTMSDYALIDRKLSVSTITMGCDFGAQRGPTGITLVRRLLWLEERERVLKCVVVNENITGPEVASALAAPHDCV